MDSLQATLEVMDALNEAGTPYMLVGSLSSNFYGIPRSTQDADLVIHLGSVSIRTVTDRLPPELRLDPQMSFETVTGTCRYQIFLRNNHFCIELFLLSDDPHDRERFGRRRTVTLEGHTTYVPTMEDVLIAKLRWLDRLNRDKDREDIRNILVVQQGKIDLDYLRSWCDRHGTRELLETMLGN